MGPVSRGNAGGCNRHVACDVRSFECVRPDPVVDDAPSVDRHCGGRALRGTPVVWLQSVACDSGRFDDIYPDPCLNECHLCVATKSEYPAFCGRQAPLTSGRYELAVLPVRIGHRDGS